MADPVPRVIHEHVEAAEAVAELVDDVPAVGEVRGVQVRHLGLAASVADLGRCVQRTILIRVPGDPGVQAGRGQRDRCGAPDS